MDDLKSCNNNSDTTSWTNQQYRSQIWSTRLNVIHKWAKNTAAIYRRFVHVRLLRPFATRCSCSMTYLKINARAPWLIYCIFMSCDMTSIHFTFSMANKQVEMVLWIDILTFVPRHFGQLFRLWLERRWNWKPSPIWILVTIWNALHSVLGRLSIW